MKSGTVPGLPIQAVFGRRGLLRRGYAPTASFCIPQQLANRFDLQPQGHVELLQDGKILNVQLRPGTHIRGDQDLQVAIGVMSPDANYVEPQALELAEDMAVTYLQLPRPLDPSASGGVIQLFLEPTN